MNDSDIQPGTIVCWSRDAVATDVNGEVVLMNLERDRCYGLGETGSAIWRQMREPVRVADLVQTLRTEFDAPHGVLEADVIRTLGEFAQEGLIQTIGARDTPRV